MKRPFSARVLGLVASMATASLLASCESIVEVTDPDIILDANSAAGAIALRNGALLRLAQATSGASDDNGGLFLFSGLLADEWISGDTFEQRNSTDQRNVAVSNSFLAIGFRAINRVRNLSDDAIASLRQYNPNPTGNVGMMFAVRAFAENQIGETYCNGIPFSDYIGADLVFGAPLPYDSAFARAVASADSAQLYVAGPDGARVTNFAKVIKGRALLNRGQFAAAAQAVAGVPVAFRWDVTHSENTENNQIWELNSATVGRYVVAEREGGTGLPFISAADPRVPTTPGGRLAFDSNTPLIVQQIYARNDPVAIASGIEALMIQAEAAMQANDLTTWLARLNDARATRSLAPLTDPGSAAARVDLTFRERAFWMFSTGHRLGDLRRLIRQYGRAQNTVFPTGTHFKGPAYGTAVNFPISFDELNNPNAPGNQQESTCTDRAA